MKKIYSENLVKISEWVQAVEHPQSLSQKNIQSVAMAPVVAGYTPNTYSVLDPLG